MTVGIITGAASDPNFVSNPSRGSIVMAVVATSAAALAKRNRVNQYEQTGYAEPGSSEELHKEALFTEPPKE